MVAPHASGPLEDRQWTPLAAFPEQPPARATQPGCEASDRSGRQNPNVGRGRPTSRTACSASAQIVMGELNQLARLSFDCPIVQSQQQFALDMLAADEVFVSLPVELAHTGVKRDEVAAPGWAGRRDA